MNDELEKFPMLMKLHESYTGNNENNFFSRIPYELTKAPWAYIEVEEGLALLNDTNFNIYKNEILQRGNGHPLRGYSEISDKFNELIGFRYLSKNGFSNIKFLETDGKNKMPDLVATKSTKNDTILEVKSINVSDEDRRTWNESAKNEAMSVEVLSGLPSELKTKIWLTVNKAMNQLMSFPYPTVNKMILLVVAMDTNRSLSKPNWEELQNYLAEIAKKQTVVKLMWYYRYFGEHAREELGISGFQSL